MKWTRVDAGTARRASYSFKASPAGHHVRHARHDDDETVPAGMHMSQLVAILRRRSKLILTGAVCGTLLATAIGLLIPPKYTALAQIVVAASQGGSSGGASTPTSSDESEIDTQVKMLTSRDHLQRVLNSLSQDPLFAATAKGPKQTSVDTPSGDATADASDVGEFKRRLQVWTGALSKSGHPTALSLDELERRLAVAQEGRSRVISVRFTSKSPEKAAIVANKVVQLYIDGQAEQKWDYTSSELARLRQRIGEVRSEILQAGTTLQKSIQQQAQGTGAQGSNQRQEDVARLRELEREAAATALVSERLLRREKEILSQQADIAPEVRILSLASPPDQPSSHNPLLFILPALIIFLIGGSFVAVIKEQADSGLRSERDVNLALGVRCIGLVPQLPRMRNTRPHQYLQMEPFSAYTESIRSVVGQLWLAAPERAPATILMSSSVPGEGKTTAAVSIAVCAAQLGRRVLLIDLDFKRPAVSRELGGSAERGIFDLILRNRTADEVIKHIPDLGLDYLPLSCCPVDVLPLLASDQIPNVLRQLQEKYDCVIIDGPPLLGIAESRLLAPMVDKVVLVVKWGSTRCDVAQHAIDFLRSCGGLDKHVDAPIVLMTQVDLKKHAAYRYGDASESLAKYKYYYSRSART